MAMVKDDQRQMGELSRPFPGGEGGGSSVEVVNPGLVWGLDT